MLTIRNHNLEQPLVLAPMMDITGQAFRAVVRHYGGCGLFYSEMLNSRRVPRESLGSPIFKGFGEEKDLVLQLLGNDPVCLEASVRRLEELFHPWGFDLNLGCARAPIMQHGWGAAMLGDATATARAVAAMRRATDLPLSVKLRTAWQSQAEAKEFLSMLENEGVDALVVHPRTTEKVFARPAQWERITEIKSRVKIPVIGNGDVLTAQDALEMFRQTGCDGVMIGRSAVPHPYLFREIAALQKGEAPEPKPSALEVWDHFIACLGDEVTTTKRTLELKTFCEYFARGLPVPHWFWGPIQGQRDAHVILSRGREFLERNGL